LKIGVLGQGRFGTGLAQKLHSLSMDVTSWSRSPRECAWKNSSFEEYANENLSEYDSLIVATGSADPGTCTASNEIARTFELFSRNYSAQSSRVIYLSSGAVYGECKSQMSENQPPNPTTSYGFAKLSAENEMRRELGDRLQVLRIGNIIPAKMDFGIFQAIRNSFERGTPITFFGTPSDCRDYLGEEEILRILSNIVVIPNAETLINIGSGTSLSLGEIADSVTEVTRGAIETYWNNRRITDVARTRLDCRKIQLSGKASAQDLKLYLNRKLALLWEESTVNG
jgi:nucleoside-diphosphate-sugar epimerase